MGVNIERQTRVVAQGEQVDGRGFRVNANARVAKDRLIEPQRDGPGLYITLGEFPGTLALFTERGFEELSTRLETEYEQGEASRRFELQFYALASYVEMDKQGRVVLPERLVRKARLGEQVFIVGQKHRIEIWKRP